ncbi:unnamed protein product [Peronospora belbahrii]|uniref:Uncharacterized protein n=1 Tax=Peronospora belbahrii TaxID=622444 RepID=A0ABN8CTP5_9STRA|nr:unnamed protein product [Peronospora belbahrii]
MWTLVAVVLHIVNSIIPSHIMEILLVSAKPTTFSFSWWRAQGTVQFVLQVVYAVLCLLWLHYCPFDDARTIGYVVKSCLFDTVRTIGYYIGAKNSELSWRLETRRHTLELVVTQVKTDLVVRENPSLLRRVMP